MAVRQTDEGRVVPGTASEGQLPEGSWHSLTAEAALAAFAASPQGLANGEAAARLERFGPNALPAAAPKPAWKRFLEQFDNLLIYVLLTSSVVTLLLGHFVDTGVILGVVVINAVIGFLQEGKAERALESIRGMISPRASVLRDGRRLTVAAGGIVPGDLLILEAGDRVTADVRLTRARNLKIDEAVLTGESVPVEKAVVPVAADVPLGDRRSMGFSGTLVTAGQGLGVVVATGPRTELGRISALLGQVERLETPLIRQMNVFARQLTLVILGLSAVTFLFAILVRGYALGDAFMAIVGMAVAAIPEGLPAVLTVTLAIGVQRMAARNAIIRRLPAVETLGSVTTICSDKTGTLTRNEMTVTTIVTAERRYEVGGEGYAPKGGFSLDGQEIAPEGDAVLMRLARAALLCNDAALTERDGTWSVDGDPMEGALVSLGLKAGLDAAEAARLLPRVDEIPFDAAHRFMATLHHGHDGGAIICVKGAPEQLIQLCRYQAASAGRQAIDRSFWLGGIDALARDGERVLALAGRPAAAARHELSFDDIDEDLELIGLVGLIDPPRPEAIAAVAECRSAGITVKMITGDHTATAAAIAADLGIERAEAPLSGADLDALDGPALAEAATRTNVFARTSPEHKLRLVEALQSAGRIVSMTGDGVNDAPALKRAEVGVAMGGNGTEAAKEAADMVLVDDNFASIVAAVREGRIVYDNLIKVIGWTLPTNGGETIIILAGILFGLTLPITPAQILWVNMVTAVGLGLVLAFEPAEPNIMTRPPRQANEALLSGFLVWRVGLVSLLVAIGAFGMFFWAETRGLPIEVGRTLVVNTVVVMEIFYLFSVRYLHGGSITWRGMLGTPSVLIGVGSIVALQFAFTYLPVMQFLFDTRNVGLVDGLVIVAVGVAMMVLLEIEKVVRRGLFARDWLGRRLP